jgi:ribosome maturation factor RimP
MTMAPTARRSARDVVAAVRPIAAKLAEIQGLVLWDVGFVREAGRESLRVACDRVGGVVSEELAALAEDLSRELDHVDAVPGDRRYVLEVTSPGAERRLRGPEQFRVCVGRDARVALRDGRVVEGKISDGTTDNVVELETPDGAVRIFLQDIARAQLIVRGIG